MHIGKIAHPMAATLRIPERVSLAQGHVIYGEENEEGGEQKNQVSSNTGDHSEEYGYPRENDAPEATEDFSFCVGSRGMPEKCGPETGHERDAAEKHKPAQKKEAGEGKWQGGGEHDGQPIVVENKKNNGGTRGPSHERATRKTKPQSER